MPKSKARKAYDELETQVKALLPVYDAKASEERAKAAEDMKRRMAEQQKKTAAPERKAPAPSKPLPESMYEPVGTSAFGMEEGEVEIRRGPQAELFLPTKAETRKRAEAAEERARQEGAEEAEPPRAETPEGQMELDFTTETAPASEEVIPETDVVAAIDKRPMIEVAQWAADNLYDPDQALIASRVVAKLKELEKLGVTLNPVEVTPSGKRLASGAMGFTQLQRTAGAPSTISITLNHPSNGDQAGTSPEVLLHELLHAATIGSVEIGRYASAKGTRVGDITTDLYKLTNAVINHFNARVKNGETLTPFEEQIYRGQNNALRDAHEVLVWALTNRSMQQYMESIPYKGQTAWNKFVTLVRDMLGIPAKADTALSEALRVADTLLDLKAADIRGAEKVTKQQFAVSVPTEQLIDSMGPINNEQRGGLKALIDGVKGQVGDPDKTTRGRSTTSSAAASRR